MIDTGLIYAACAWVLLPVVTSATDYQFYVNEQFDQNVLEEHYEGEVFLGVKVEVCVEDYYTDEVYQYTASNSQGTTELSLSLTVQWVWDFDDDDDGIVGMADFGVFCNDYGTTLQRSDATQDGIVGFADFGRFTQRFGECNNEVYVVACG